MRKKRTERQSVFVGELVKTKYGFAELIEYRGSKDCDIRFEDGTIITCYPHNFKQGSVFNPNFPTHCGKGFIGIGGESARCCGKPSYAYVKWKAMLDRCYGTKKDKNISYEGCEVSTDWFNFQNFSKWIKSQIGYGEAGWHLDKDLKVKGNNIYSEDTCFLVPHDINSFLLKREGARGLWPIGVVLHKNRFIAAISIDGKQKHIGSFDDPVSAFNAYKIEKEFDAQRLVCKYDGVVDPEILKKLLEFRVEITD